VRAAGGGKKAMELEAIRRYCLGFSYTSENVQWGSDLCFKLDGKLFVVAALESGPHRVSFKTSPENFAELCERPGISPAPYMARAQWVSLERFNTLGDAELRELIAQSYRLVWERLTKKRRQQLEGEEGGATAKAGRSNSKGKQRKAPTKTKSAKATG
jgi:predicted DNA-binding protein (MmcQ/YjbR family)